MQTYKWPIGSRLDGFDLTVVGNHIDQYYANIPLARSQVRFTTWSFFKLNASS